MDNFLSQKKQWQQNFRINIQKFMAQSQQLHERIQFTPQLILSALKNSANAQNSIIKNGRINVESLEEVANMVNGHRIMPRMQFLALFGNKKQFRVSELSQMLKELNLGEFNLNDQIKRYSFQNGSLSLNRLDKMMAGQGFKVLNAKDKSILIECFDMNKDSTVCQKDIEQLIGKLDAIRSKDAQKSLIGVIREQ